ncbi:hypothetical protein [Pseudovibrio sp. Alg231-02]|nr:hypothetical protein [Pseudovibrio sp. Alg231-02]
MTDTKLDSARRNKESGAVLLGLEGFGWDGEYPGVSKVPSGLNGVL